MTVTVTSGADILYLWLLELPFTWSFQRKTEAWNTRGSPRRAQWHWQGVVGGERNPASWTERESPKLRCHHILLGKRNKVKIGRVQAIPWPLPTMEAHVDLEIQGSATSPGSAGVWRPRDKGQSPLVPGAACNVQHAPVHRSILAITSDRAPTRSIPQTYPQSYLPFQPLAAMHLNPSEGNLCRRGSPVPQAPIISSAIVVGSARSALYSESSRPSSPQGVYAVQEAAASTRVRTGFRVYRTSHPLAAVERPAMRMALLARCITPVAKRRWVSCENQPSQTLAKIAHSKALGALRGKKISISAHPNRAYHPTPICLRRCPEKSHNTVRIKSLPAFCDGQR
ncbi:hypothetical protein DFP72DRAFT_1047569 [Ephemerocybe angulata]|uniref:Uncharacterized protein n=1 Tax=Ephemerocybe angulata TaxID=980116 RepID=A0A8H6M142_9AGAR|nr:hypothetical protein DFP72DRAFT_1047569 [Tulosesus angulatus]